MRDSHDRPLLGRQRKGVMMHYVQSRIGEGYPDPPYNDPAQAVQALLTGRAIRWEPGYGSGYDLLLVTRMWVTVESKPFQRWVLDVTSQDTYAIALHDSEWTAQRWARERQKVGAWADMKPLLVELGAARQMGAYHHSYDQQNEADARIRRSGDSEQGDARDARLGHKIRRLVEADLARTNPTQKDA